MAQIGDGPGNAPRLTDDLLVRGDVFVDHPLDAEALDRRASGSRPGRVSDGPSTAATAASTSATRNPVPPSSISSGIEPRSNAITGVPQAIASTTL